MKTLAALCTCLALALAGCNPPGKTTPEGPDLQESADGIPERTLESITEADVGKTVVLAGQIQTRAFDGAEGKQLMAGEKVMARMLINLKQERRAEGRLVFRPTNRKELLPEIETTIRVIGVVKSVIDNTGRDKGTPLEKLQFAEKHIRLEDCRFAR